MLNVLLFCAVSGGPAQLPLRRLVDRIDAGNGPELDENIPEMPLDSRLRER
jgi:hypothetical protein